MTNADRIRAMSTEELARWLVYHRANVRLTGNRTIGEPAIKATLEWLKEEVEVDKMPAQEAIKLLHPDTTKEAIAEIEYYCGFHGKEAAMKAIEEACLLACDALEKQVPKEPKMWRNPPCYPDWADDDWGWECPNCGNQDIDYIDHHCKCGQAIDWTKEEG